VNDVSAVIVRALSAMNGCGGRFEYPPEIVIVYVPGKMTPVQSKGVVAPLQGTANEK
jgi:hypothetical protein